MRGGRVVPTLCYTAFSLWALSTWILLLASTAVEARCYNSKGTPWVFTNDEPVEAWMPCNLTAEVTNCCSPWDYCMSNGLCMDAVIDNVISQQGCTDKDWGEPCFNYCEGKESDAAGLHFFWRCVGQSYCCGNNRSTTCCEDPGVETVQLPVGLSLHHPPNPSTSTSKTTTSTSTAVATVTTSPDAASTAGGDEATSSTPIQTRISSPTASTAATPNNDHSVAIGLGVGIPLGLGMIAAVCFLGLQIQKRSQKPKPEAAPAQMQWNTPEYYKTPEQYIGELPHRNWHQPSELDAREMAELRS
ncbi:uncharacterized protein BCR38DRAFT_147102 [Pseudomassariella vexata]|uniref:Mid2 domain-containing protein n=1 Tax=Pseudomassariella vexata TaxID=1141098 RepID=A0A1Y2D615_9PEZI|nr:uncharacterized protein BCR38DRAFT_147102 [Pseudomassariella vexata]ORY54722.1 hypothetical protein BCR38DRAFT_147102 [Pseudomassariella vexata]